MSARRPLPALAFLLALSLLTALVWWRVFDRANGGEPTAPETCVAKQDIALPAPGTVNVTVLNGTSEGTNRVGLAGDVSSLLAAAGFVMADPDNDPVVVDGTAQIRFGPAGLPGATLLQYYIPGSVLVATESITDAAVVVSVGEQFPQTGGVNTAEQAAAAIEVAKAAPKAGGKSC